MPRKPAPKRDDPEESERFIKTAREIAADERPETFEREFTRIVPAKRASNKPD